MRENALLMLRLYRQRRHAGEEDAIAIYNYSIGLQFLNAAAICALLWPVLGMFAADFADFIRIEFLVLFLVPVLPKRRIAIIFTEHELIYRPAIASPLRIRLHGVQAIRRGKVNVPWNPGWQVEGAVLELHYAQSFALRLDFPDSERIVQRLSYVTGVPVS
jgi:hypothetical protein